MSRRLSRRALLRGAGGIAIALPALEIMQPADACAAESPKRYVVSYAGVSTGRQFGGASSVDVITPGESGSTYAVTPALAPLEARQVREHVTVVSGLVIPWQTGGSVPVAGRVREFHGTTVVPQISGTASVGRNLGPAGATSDRIVAGAIADGTTHPVLSYRVQPAVYAGANQSAGNGGRISWRVTSSGTPVALDPIVSPRLAYESLFTGFQPDDPEEAAAIAAEIGRRKSALDRVKGGIERLLPLLGTRDRQRLDRHFEEIRALERRLDDVIVPQDACELLPHPGDDPPVGGALVDNGAGYTTTAGYSGEDERAELLTDFIAMAFACDLSRVAALQLTWWKCWMNLHPIAGHQTDIHETTHGAGPTAALADAVAWHVDVFARLVAKLDATPEPQGGTVLDHSALLLLFEGGVGYDPEAERENSSHSTENMVALLAGRAGGLSPGTHVRAQGRHPAEVVNSAMNAVGASGGLNDVTTTIDEVLA